MNFLCSHFQLSNDNCVLQDVGVTIHHRELQIVCIFLLSSAWFRNPVPRRVLHHVCTDESDSNSRRRAAHTRPVGSLPHGEWAAAPVLDIFS